MGGKITGSNPAIHPTPKIPNYKIQIPKRKIKGAGMRIGIFQRLSSLLSRYPKIKDLLEKIRPELPEGLTVEQILKSPVILKNIKDGGDYGPYLIVTIWTNGKNSGVVSIFTPSSMRAIAERGDDELGEKILTRLAFRNNPFLLEGTHLKVRRYKAGVMHGKALFLSFSSLVIRTSCLFKFANQR